MLTPFAPSRLSLALSACFAVVLSVPLASPSLADEVRLNSGEVLKGRIVSEGEDFVRIEVAVSETIRETRMISRADIASVMREAPDKVEFARIQSLVPTPSLMGINEYRSLLETGPDAFLRDFPGSEHVEEVREIRALVAEELEKVERGFVKIGEDWISPQERAEFEARVNSRIGLERMRRHVDRGDPNSLILAMREFEAIDQRYRGTPAHVDALELALSVVPNLGRRMQGLLRDVEFRNAEWERNKAQMEEDARAQVEAARAREEEQYKAAVEADRRSGIKWTRFDPRSEASLEAYLKLAEGELRTLQAVDVPELRRQAALLSEADDLIAKGELSSAASKLAAATGSAPAKGARKAPAKAAGARGATTYAGILTAKLGEAQAERTAQAKAREAAAKAKSLSPRRRAEAEAEAAEAEAEPTEGDAEPSEGDAAEGVETEEGAEPTEAAETAEAAPPAPEDDFAALAGPRKGAKAAAAETPEAQPAQKARPSQAIDPEEQARRVAAANTGDGFPKWLIIPIVTALLLVVVVVLKVTGIGGKKEEAEE